MKLGEVLEKGFTVMYKNKSKKLSIKEVALIYRGIRPSYKDKEGRITYMDRELFKSIRRELKKLLKEYKKGELFHLAKMTSTLWQQLGGKKNRQKGSTFKGKVHEKTRQSKNRTK